MKDDWPARQRWNRGVALAIWPEFWCVGVLVVPGSLSSGPSLHPSAGCWRLHDAAKRDEEGGEEALSSEPESGPAAALLSPFANKEILRGNLSGRAWSPSSSPQ